MRGRLFTREEDVPKGPGGRPAELRLLEPALRGRSRRHREILSNWTGSARHHRRRPAPRVRTVQSQSRRPGPARGHCAQSGGRAVRAFARLKPGVTLEQARAPPSAPLFEEERARVPVLYRPGTVAGRPRPARPPDLARCAHRFLDPARRGLPWSCSWPVSMSRTSCWRAPPAAAASSPSARRSGPAGDGCCARRSRKACCSRRSERQQDAAWPPRSSASSSDCAGWHPAARPGRRSIPASCSSPRPRQPAPGSSSALLPAMERLRQALIAVQIAASLVLLTGAGLLLETLWSMERVPLGIDTRNAVAAAHFTLRRGYSEARLRGFYTALRNTPAAVPGGGHRGHDPALRRVDGDSVFRARCGGPSPPSGRRRRQCSVARRHARLLRRPRHPAAARPHLRRRRWFRGS